MSGKVQFPAKSKSEAEHIKALWLSWYSGSTVEIKDPVNNVWWVVRTPPSGT